MLLHNCAVSKVARIPAILGIARHMGLVDVLEVGYKSMYEKWDVREPKEGTYPTEKPEAAQNTVANRTIDGAQAVLERRLDMKGSE